jgi:Icc-related predicted phosphoesterase
LELIAISDIYGDILRVKALTSILGHTGSENRIIIIAGDLSRGDASEKSVKDSMEILSEACRYLFYVPGDCDPKDFKIELANAINLDEKN